jgi:hypothetical protein
VEIEGRFVQLEVGPNGQKEKIESLLCWVVEMVLQLFFFASMFLQRNFLVEQYFDWMSYTLQKMIPKPCIQRGILFALIFSITILFLFNCSI